MSWTIPESGASVALREGSSGIAVWSLQKALCDVKRDVVADGAFGAKTKAAVTAFQESVKITADGVAGPTTQHQIAVPIIKAVEAVEPVPAGLLPGFAEGEGGWILGSTNWSISRRYDPSLPLAQSGCDCGLFQRRVYEVDWHDDAVIERAFNTSYQADLIAKTLLNLRGAYIARTGTNDHFGGMGAHEKAWRLAALSHNYPAGADTLSRTPIADLSSYWRTSQAWVVNAMTWTDSQGGKHRVKFPNGTPIDTPLQWVHSYAGLLGAGVYGTSGSVTRYTSVWP